MSETRYQRMIVWGAILFLYWIMLLVLYVFSMPNTIRAIDIYFSSSVVKLSPQFFAFFTALVLLAIPLQLTRAARRLKPIYRRSWYVASATPLLLYTIPAALYSNTPFGLLLSLSIYFSFWVIAGASFRPKFK